MADLITLTELKVARGVPLTDTTQDDQFTQMIALASSVIRAHSGRDFGAPVLTEQRIFDYDDTGYIDIDDASAITQVAIQLPNVADFVLQADQWRAMPSLRDDEPVYWYLVLPEVAMPYGSPAMGFTRNLDVYVRAHGYAWLPPRVAVTGTWGWPAIPEPVKLATLWTLEDWLTEPTGGEDLTSEAIEGFSRSWGGRSSGRIRLALPSRALDILANYDKIYV